MGFIINFRISANGDGEAPYATPKFLERNNLAKLFELTDGTRKTFPVSFNSCGETTDVHTEAPEHLVTHRIEELGGKIDERNSDHGDEILYVTFPELTAKPYFDPGS